MTTPPFAGEEAAASTPVLKGSSTPTTPSKPRILHLTHSAKQQRLPVHHSTMEFTPCFRSSSLAAKNTREEQKYRLFWEKTATSMLYVTSTSPILILHSCIFAGIKSVPGNLFAENESNFKNKVSLQGANVYHMLFSWTHWLLGSYGSFWWLWIVTASYSPSPVVSIC